ncbi:MAG: DUF4359 domain-containing protein [Pseudanabaena sp. RU_4_16]|nr:DUF4359 domain-containing protein [Pseudanabaena sp. RU_4_16]NKB18532.1 DUF4359 domain-containing protein [Pseudanabaena sp. CRU_2_10]
MNKLVIALVGLGAIAAAMGFTNPQKEQFLEYASTKLATEAKNAVCKPQNSSDLNSLIANACKSGIDLQKDLAKVAIDSATRQENMLLFSIYTTEFPGKKYQTVGIFGNFFTSN